MTNGAISKDNWGLLIDSNDSFPGMFDNTRDGSTFNFGPNEASLANLQFLEDESIIQPVKPFIPTISHNIPETPPTFYGETENRQIKIYGLDKSTQEDEINIICSQFGEINSIDMSQIKNGIVFVLFFDLRSAINARMQLPGTILHGSAMFVNFARFLPVQDQKTPINEGTIVIFHLNTNPPDDQLIRQFGQFGAIKQIRRSPKRITQRFIEYYDIRDALKAKENMNGKKYLGATLVVDFSLPGGFRKASATGPKRNSPIVFSAAP